jgi:hypothetical protein
VRQHFEIRHRGRRPAYLDDVPLFYSSFITPSSSSA